MEAKRAAHVLVFPFPAQGHINQMLKLAELLCLSGLHVTFLNTQHNHHRLSRFADLHSRFRHFPHFRLQTIPDGLPPDYPRRLGFLKEWIYKVDVNTQIKPLFRQLLIDTQSPPVTCIISDGVLTFTIDVGKELGIPTISFRTVSACCLWTYLWLPELVETGDLPFGDGVNMDQRVRSIPGTESFLRRRDLPSFFREKEIDETGIEFVVTETENSTQAYALILNTFGELEGPVLSQISSRFPKVYTIGPLHVLLDVQRSNLLRSPPAFPTGFWEEDRSCIGWLDSQPEKSVIYVSFGSVVSLNRDEMLEFWHGLVRSGFPFLWAIRPDSINEGKDEIYEIPAELEEGTAKRGCIVRWAPQEEVMKHAAIGGFLTHSGWSSTLESEVCGVPMLCWPHFADQPVNSRFVAEVWKIGLDMKDACDRRVVEEMVRNLMEKRREELSATAIEMGKMAKRCVSEGGTSLCNLEALICELKAMCE